MTIRDRDRKVLWSRAGNCCSICRALMVRKGEIGRALTVIGEECHIVSPAPVGPRSGLPGGDLDGYDNLILLCPNDHRLVDTLVDDYPPERLRAMKSAHEDWVGARLRPGDVAPVTIVRGEPTVLRLLATGREVLAVAASAEESSLDHEDLNSDEEVDLVAGFLQSLHDTAEMWDDFEPADRIRATYDLDREIEELKDRGWLVFGERARGRLRGGVTAGDAIWETAYLRLVRCDSPQITRAGLASDGEDID